MNQRMNQTINRRLLNFLKRLFISLSTFVTLSLYAKEINWTYENYKQAESGSNSIAFEMESTKAGLITTGFKGLVKKASVKFEEIAPTTKEGATSFVQWKNISMTIPVESLDTDSDGRNEKMWDTCLGRKEFPEIKIDIPGPVVVVEGNNKFEGNILIRGLHYPLIVYYNLKRLPSGKWEMTGTSETSISALKIPDPSIFIAKVRDRIDLKIKIEI